MEKILTALEDYRQQMKLTRRFSVESLQRKIEPFIEANRQNKYEKLTSPRILILHGGGVGDFVLFSPCLREIRRLYENAQITLIVFASAENLAEKCPYVDEIYSCEFLHDIYRDNPLCYDECLSFVKTHFTLPFDIVFNYAVTFPGALLAYMSGAAERFLYISRQKWGLFNAKIPYDFASSLSTVMTDERKYSPHLVDRYLSILDNMLTYPLLNREIEIWYTEDDRIIAKRIMSPWRGKKCIVLCMGGIGGFKSYPPEKYAELMRRILAENENYHIIIIGGTFEESAGEIVKKSLPSGVVTDLTGELTFRQTAALLSQCHCYIGNDTSCMHIAAAVKVPVLVTYSYAVDLPYSESASIIKYHPYHVPAVICRPQKAKQECKALNHTILGKHFGCLVNEPHCICEISVEELYDGWRRLKAHRYVDMKR